MTVPALRTDHLGLQISGARIVEDITLDIAQGEFVAVIGPNGAGKTSLLNLISGTARSTEGSVYLHGQDITRRPTHRRAALGLARTFQTSYLLLGLSVLENVRLMVQAETVRGLGLLRRVSGSDATLARAREALDRVGLADVADRLAGALSHGERRKVELAIVIAAQAKVILLDEPMAGVNIEDVASLAELIRQVQLTSGATVIMVEHHLNVVLGLAQRVAVMHHGAMLAFDKPDKVMVDPAVLTAYVGDAVSADAILELEDVHASIGVSHILQGVSLRIPRNVVTVVLGRNGVGKTTTLRSVLGLVRRTGRITFAGKEIARMQTHDIVREGISYVPEDRDVFRGLTVLENLRLAERKGRQHRYDLVYELFPELRQRSNQVAGTLSGGQQQMVSLGRGLLNDDPLILIDEPTKGLAPRVVGEVVDVLDRARHVSTIVMVEQNLLAARRLAGYVVVMAEGRVVKDGSPDLLADDEQVTALLGLGREGVTH